MKVKFKCFALFAMLSVLAVSCQKEEVIEPVDVQIQQSATIRNVTYKVDGATMHATIRGEQNWQDFVDWLFALAEEGHRVSFRNESIYNNQQHSKDTVVYTTKDKNKANAWAAEMSELGYEVSIDYDRNTGVYTCTATN